MARAEASEDIPVFEIAATTAAEAYTETLGLLQSIGVDENSRNGRVVTLQEPFMLTLKDPTRRIIRCPIRDANPFFHLMETVWMFAGKRDCEWLLQFNKRIGEYANDGVINGAYGWRWFEHWGNQPLAVAQMLKRDNETRQAVIAMWDPSYDLQPHWKDRPCNTHIYFRVVKGMLDMTVCNRSNDLVWGMFGANIVHLTFLHEFVATAADLPLGKYRVFTNNLHFYRDLYPNGEHIWDNIVQGRESPRDSMNLVTADNYRMFRVECEAFIRGDYKDLGNHWLRWVAQPMKDAYLSRTYEGAMAHLQLCDDLGWRLACEEWVTRHRKPSLCSTCD